MLDDIYILIHILFKTFYDIFVLGYKKLFLIVNYYCKPTSTKFLCALLYVVTLFYYYLNFFLHLYYIVI